MRVILSNLANALGKATRHGEDYSCRCPVTEAHSHGDRTPSLTLSFRDGKLLVNCHAGCAQDDVFRRVLEIGKQVGAIYDDDRPPSRLPLGISEAWKDGDGTRLYFRQLWCYRSEAGTPLGYVVRYENESKKLIIPYFAHRAEKGKEHYWKAKHPEAPKPLFNLDKLAARRSEVVWIVEGEKCAEALGATGRLATTWIGGAAGVAKADLRPLGGRELILWPDNDEAGFSAMNAAKRILEGLDPPPINIEEVQAAELGLPQGGDCADVQLTEDYLAHLPRQTASRAYNLSVEIHELTVVKHFIKRFGGECRASVGQPGVFLWNSRNWHHDSELIDTRRLLSAHILPRIRDEAALAPSDKEAARLIRFYQSSSSKAKLDALLSLIRAAPEIQIKTDDMDPEPWSLNVANGIVDLRTGVLGPHDRQRYCSKISSVKYSASSPAPLWERFVHRIMGEQADLVSYLQRAIGYTATGLVDEQVMFLCYGNGANGKSVLMEAVRYVLGNYSASLPADVLTSASNGNANRIDQSLARLRGTRIGIANETSEKDRLNEALIKQITGGDTITGRYLYHGFFDFAPRFKLWLRTNHRPEISGSDDGIWRRMHLIPFEVKIPDEEKDKKLLEKLQAESEGILRWIVDGAKSYFKQGLAPPRQVLAAVKEYREEMDNIGAFLLERCTLIHGISVRSSELYEAFREWTEARGERVVTHNLFSRRLKDQGFKTTRDRYGMKWEDMTLKEAEQEEEKGFGII